MATSHLALLLGLLACASVMVQSTTMYCRLTDQKGGGYFVDLSPLKLADSSWKAISTDDHDYYMNVCDGLKGMDTMSDGCMPDSDPTVAVCQDKKNPDGTTVDRFPKIAGSADENEASLDWLDDIDKGKGVVLQYKHGEGNNETACHSMYSRVTTIRFSCKEGSGMGNPVFIKEGEECEFLFSWETEFACLRTSSDPIDDVVACTAINSDGYVIDLQPLAKEESDWQVGNGDNMYHLNLCHALKGTFAGDCNVKSSGCQTGAEGLEKSLGWSGVPKKQNDDITVSFTNGTRCHVGKDAEGPRSTKIVFHCDDTAGLGEPIFSGEDAGEGGKGCLYLFEWTTAVACKPLEPVSGNCSVYDNIDEHTYDLSALRLSDVDGYTMSYNLPGSDEEHVYNVNICGVDKRCGDERSAACIVGDTTSSIGVASSKLEYNHGFLWLSYNTSIVCGDGFQSVDILFLCNHEATVAETTSQAVDSKFFRVQNEAGMQGCKHLLEYESELACPPMEEISCEVQDPDTGAVYDLTNLNSNSGGWEVFSEESKTAKYLLNLCSPVKSDSLCADDQGACQVMYEGDDLMTASSSHNIGRLSKPRLITSPTDPTQIVLDYVGGEVCHKTSATRLLRSTSINIYCQPGAGVGEPVFLDETDCHYHFEWYSASACAVTKGTNGTECMVTDPRTGHAFDFRSLTSTTTDYSVTNGEYEYLFNVCGPSQCDPHYGGCQKKIGDQQATGIGKWSNQLTVTDDVVRLAYADGVGPCHTTSVRHMQINFACPTSESKDGDISFIEEDANCGYFVEFTTNLACAAAPIQCIVNGPDGVIYDFTRLMINSDDSSNYLTSNPLTGDMFEINICRSLVETESSCPTQAAACLSQANTDPSVASKSFNLGLPAKPTWDPVTGHPVITYVGGDYNDFNSTNIVFVCPAQGDSTSGLAFNSIICDDRDNSKSCTHSFTYYTQLVCLPPSGGPTDKPGFHPEDTVKGVACKVTDPVSGDSLDFSDMGSQSWPHSEHALSDIGGHAYTLGVCSNTPVTCGDKTDAMACQSKDDKAWSLGVADQESMGLELVNGVARITYTGGEKCHVNKSTESTRGALIEFRCHPAAGLGYPIFRNETDDCKYDFLWETAKACLSPYKPSDCKANDGKQFFDLSSLAKHDSNWKVSDPLTDAVYEVNVCRALVPSLTSKCNHTAGACQTNTDGSQRSLGFVTEPKFNDEGKLVLKYEGGDLCHGGQFARALLIEFVCPRDGSGRALSGVTDSPVFVAETDDCMYKFSWRTSAACAVDDTFVPVAPTRCEISSPTSGQSFDLTPLSGISFSTYSADSNFRYEMQFCGSVVGLAGACSHVGACQTEVSSGTLYSLGSTAGLSWSSSGLREDFTNGSKCHEGNYERTSTVDFRCDTTITSPSASRLEFVSEHGDCSYEFVLYTNVACTEQPIDCAYIDTDTGIEYDLSALRKPDSNWIATGTHEDYWYEINVCRGLVPNPEWHEKGAERCTGSSACQVSEETAKSLGGTKPQSFSLKTENGNLVLRYFNGTQCSQGGTEREMLIEFACGKNVGQPVFVGEATYCQYKFAWATSYACGPDEVPATPAPTMPGAMPACSAINPWTGRTFDLSQITTAEDVSMDSSDFFNDDGGFFNDNDGGGGASDNGETFSISPCGNQRCGGAPKAAAVCVDDKVAGDFQSAPMFQDGSVVIEYASNRAHGHTMEGCDTPPGSRIVFKCDWSPPDEPVIYLGLSECTHQFEWYTKFVCTGEAELECVIDHAGDLYDLTPLAKSWGNWVVDTAAISTLSNQDSISLNMCKQLNQPQSDCYDAAVCLSTGSSKVQAIGYMHAEPTYTSSSSQGAGIIMIWYPLMANNDDCGTSVTLVCSPGSLGFPVLTSQDGCFYGITWETSVACTAAEVTEAPAPDDNGVGSDCQVQTTASGLYFDLRSLRDLNDVARVDVPRKGATDGTSDLIKLAVCGGVNSTQWCDSVDAGACVQDGKSWGEASHQLSYISNSLVLEYLKGDTCVESDGKHGQHTTLIMFECEDEANPGSPEYDETLSSVCKHVFIWKTEHACPHVDDFSCVVKDKANNVFDLSPLKRMQKEQGNWIITGESNIADDIYEYELNLCHGLMQDSQTQVKANTACEHGTSLCQFEINTDHAKSLGVVHQPEIDDGGKLVMYLKNGDLCSHGRHRETSVEFSCDPDAGAGNPTFIAETDHCVYVVEWKTAYACAVKAATPHDPDNCHIEDVGGSAVSLVPLGDKPMHVYATSQWPEFEISVCGAQSKCIHGHVCVKKLEGDDTTARWHSLGTATALTANGGKTFTMQTTDGDRCPDGVSKRASSISFVCRKDLQNSQPQMTRNYMDCSYSFLWETPLACGQPSSCTVFNPNSKQPIFLGVLGNNIPVITSQSDTAQYHMSLCESKKNNPCMQGTRLRRTELTGSGMCVVVDNQAFSLGEMQNSVPIMSFEKTIAITYKGGDSCASLGSSVGGNGNGAATSIITFTCSQSAGMGHPRLSEKPDSSRGCVFKFAWDTCAVCDGENPCNIPPTARPTTKPGSPNSSPTAKPTGGGGDSDGNTDKESKPKSSGVAIAFIILILAAVVAGVVYFLKDAERRDKVRSLIGLTGSSGSAGAFRYKSINNNYNDSDNNLTNGLLFNSDGEDDDEDEDEDIFKDNKVVEDKFPSDLTDANNSNNNDNDNDNDNGGSDKAEDDEDLLDSI